MGERLFERVSERAEGRLLWKEHGEMSRKVPCPRSLEKVALPPPDFTPTTTGVEVGGRERNRGSRDKAVGIEEE